MPCVPPSIAVAIMLLPTTPVTLAVLRAALLLVVRPIGRVNQTHLEIEVRFLVMLDCHCCEYDFFHALVPPFQPKNQGPEKIGPRGNNMS